MFNDLDNYEQVIKIVFQYLNMLREQGAVEWIYEEVFFNLRLCKAMHAMTFKFLEKSSPSSYASNLSGNMHKYEEQDFIAGPYLSQIFDKDVIDKCMDYFTVDNLRFVISFYIAFVSNKQGLMLKDGKQPSGMAPSINRNL